MIVNCCHPVVISMHYNPTWKVTKSTHCFNNINIFKMWALMTCENEKYWDVNISNSTVNLLLMMMHKFHYEEQQTSWSWKVGILYIGDHNYFVAVVTKVHINMCNLQAHMYTVWTELLIKCFSAEGLILIKKTNLESLPGIILMLSKESCSRKTCHSFLFWDLMQYLCSKMALKIQLHNVNSQCQSGEIAHNSFHEHWCVNTSFVCWNVTLCWSNKVA